MKPEAKSWARRQLGIMEKMGPAKQISSMKNMAGFQIGIPDVSLDFDILNEKITASKGTGEA